MNNQTITDVYGGKGQTSEPCELKKSKLEKEGNTLDNNNKIKINFMTRCNRNFMQEKLA
jgi:hypothetical protein